MVQTSLPNVVTREGQSTGWEMEIQFSEFVSRLSSTLGPGPAETPGNMRLLCWGGCAATLPWRHLLCPFSLGFCLCLLLSTHHASQHTPLWLVEHGLQPELCESLGRTCCLHQTMQGRT